MFWRLSFRPVSAINTLLDKEDCTLSEILDEDDVLQECKTHNNKLIDFLVRPSNLEELVRLVCQEPGEDVEDKVKYKFPHIACELLTSEVFTITESLSSSEHLLRLLWAFLDSPDQLNPLIGSFISKVLAMLLNKEPIVIYNYMKSYEGFLSLLLNHLGTSAIMDLLLQMVAAPENDQCRIDIALWMKEQGIVEKLVDCIGKDTVSEHCTNASQALCDMYRLSRESYQKTIPAPLHDTLESKVVLQHLLDNMFMAEIPEDIVIINGIMVLLTALERRPPSTPPMGQSFDISNSEDPLASLGKDFSIDLDEFLSVLLPRLKDFHSLLDRRPQGLLDTIMYTTAGPLNPPLGSTRLQVVRLFAAILQCGNESIFDEVIRLSTFSTLIDLFFQYPWNNFLHKEIEVCVNAALISQSNIDTLTKRQPPNRTLSNPAAVEKTEGDTNSQKLAQENKTETFHQSLRLHVLSDCMLLSKILDGFERNEFLKSMSKGLRQGYMGHLIRITNNLVRYAEGDEPLKEAIKKSLDMETEERWSTFINGPIADFNKRNDTNLGGIPPMSTGIDDSDEEFDQLGGGVDSELEKAYQQYQDVKYVNSFMDDCGVEDELNPMEEPFEASFSRLMDIASHTNADEDGPQASAMFEAACQSRIKQFDDSDESDDDDETSHWPDKEVSFSSHHDQHSVSSDDDENFIQRREFQTGSSDDEDNPFVLNTAPANLTQITSSAAKDGDSDKMEIGTTIQKGIMSWQSELASNDELSGVTGPKKPGVINWITEPMSGNGKKVDVTDSSSPNWADFSTAFSARPGLDSSSPQNIGQNAGSVTSHITITYNTTSQTSPSNDDDDLIESPEHRPSKSKYRILSPSGGDDSCTLDSPSSPLDMDAIQVAVESSSDDEANSSSDSDDERSSRYDLNKSDGVPLLNSPASDELSTVSPNPTRHPDQHEATPSPIGVSRRGHQTTTSSVDKNSAETSVDPRVHDIMSEERSGAMAPCSPVNRLTPNDSATGDSELELQDNYSFLAKHGMISDAAPTNRIHNDSSTADQEQWELVEQKRAEAQQACAQWDRETKQKPQEGSLET